MNAVVQKIKGPAKAATFPSRGSTNPQKDMEMNRTKDSTANAVAASVSLYRLIAHYWTTYADLMEVMAATPGELPGTALFKAAIEAEVEAGDRLSAAEEALCAFVPSSLEEAELKAEYVSRFARSNGINNHWVDALLATLPVLYAPKAGGAA